MPPLSLSISLPGRAARRFPCRRSKASWEVLPIPSTRAGGAWSPAPGHGGTANIFIGTPLNDAVFKDLTLTKASFANVSLAGAHFDDIDFSNATITANCNFKGMRIADIPVTDLLAAYSKKRA